MTEPDQMSVNQSTEPTLGRRVSGAMDFLKQVLPTGKKLGTFQSAKNLVSFAALETAGRLRLFPKGKAYNLYTMQSAYPLRCRYGTIDRHVFNLIFREDEYECLTDVKNPKLIVDCGGNIGYSSVYFLNKYPGAHVISIEPDGSNFEMLEENLKPYADRAKAICAGVWSHETGLVVERGQYRGGREDSNQVRPVKEGEREDVWATDIQTILANSGFDQIDLLKVDIEGSEEVVFSGDPKWLASVKNLVIELHGPKCEEALYTALRNYSYVESSSGELTVFRDITLKGQ